MNCLGADNDIGDVLKLPLQLGHSIGFACGNKLYQLMAIIQSKLGRAATRALGERRRKLRVKLTDSGMPNIRKPQFVLIHLDFKIKLDQEEFYQEVFLNLGN